MHCFQSYAKANIHVPKHEDHLSACVCCVLLFSRRFESRDSRNQKAIEVRPSVGGIEVERLNLDQSRLLFCEAMRQRESNRNEMRAGSKLFIECHLMTSLARPEGVGPKNFDLPTELTYRPTLK